MTIIRVVRNRGAIGTSIEDDWVTRSTASGVFYRNNFTYRNAAETLPITTDAHLVASSWDGIVAADETLVEFDTVHKLSGNGSLRINLLASNPGAYATYRIGWDGIAASTKTTIKNAFYLQFAYYMDPFWQNYYFNTSVYGGKIALISGPDAPATEGEIVIRRDFRPGGWLSCYRWVDGGSTQLMRLFYSALSARANYAFLDRGTPVVSSLNELQQRHGPHSQTSDPTGDDPDFQWAPKLVEGDFTYLTTYVNQDEQICKIWIGARNESPTLIMGGMDTPGNTYLGLPPIGTTDGASGQLYSGCMLSSYMNHNQWAGTGDWPAQDTFVCFDEVIASDSAPTHPGGFALPFPGTEVPTGWPASGSEPT